MTTTNQPQLYEIREKVEKILYPDNLVNATYTRLTHRPLTDLMVELVADEKANSYKQGYLTGGIDILNQETPKGDKQ